MVSKGVVYLFMGCMLIFGSANTLLTKLMDLEGFSHPYMQTIGLFIGESMCMAIYLLRKLGDKSPPKPLIRRAPRTKVARFVHRLGIFAFVIPAFFNVAASTLALLGLLLSAPSVYQMIRGSVIIITAAYTKLFLNRQLFRHQYVGVVLVFVGVTAVGLSGVFGAQNSAVDPVLGIIILICAQFFQAGNFTYEENLLDDFEIEPLLAVGVEGVTGVLVFSVLLLPVLYLIPCNANHICSGGRVEDTPAALEQLFSNVVLPTTFAGIIISLGIFNFAGMTTTKLTTSLARSIIDTCRTLVVWMVSLAVGWEVISPFTALQLFGFLLLILGTFIYNQIIVFNACGIRTSVEAYNIYIQKIKENESDTSMHLMLENGERTT